MLAMLCTARPVRALQREYSLLSDGTYRMLPEPDGACLPDDPIADEGAPPPASRFHLLGTCVTYRLDHAVRMPAELHTAETQPSLLAGALMTAGVIVYNAANSFPDHHEPGFHFANEGWFAEDSYVGGADKVGHFVKFGILARELTIGFEYFGYSQPFSILAGFAVSSFGGLVNEIGDGTNRYGFSYEDLVMDVLGAGAVSLVSLTRTEDLFGFRFGVVPGPSLPDDPSSDGFGKDYSRDIYTADLLLTGLIRRTIPALWPLRFLLVSVTYGSRGYPYSAQDVRQRLVGFEVGLNFGEILYAFKVEQDTWWGVLAHGLLDNFRIPFTQAGFRCDLNHGGCFAVNADGY